MKPKTADAPTIKINTGQPTSVSLESPSMQNQVVQELNQKLIEANNQTNQLKVELSLTKQQLEASQKENAEIKAQLKQTELYSGKQSTDAQEVKRL